MSHIAPALVLPWPRCRWRAWVKYKAVLNCFRFFTHPLSLLANCLILFALTPRCSPSHVASYPFFYLTLIQIAIKTGDNASCSCRGFPPAHFSLLWISCMSPDCGWGRAVLRTVARKRLLQLFISPRFAFLPHVLHLSLSLKLVGTCSRWPPTSKVSS